MKHGMLPPVVDSVDVPLVTLLSRLGLNASPEKRLMSSDWPANRLPFRYSLHTVMNLGNPPTGSALEGSTWYTSL